MQKCEPPERKPCAPKFEERTQDETLNQETMRPQRSMGLGEKCLSAQSKGQGHVLPPTETRVLLAPSSNNPEEREFRSIDAHAQQKGFKLRRTGYPSKIQNVHNGGNGDWRSANK